MNCVKCGRETAEERVFCDVCLKEMEDYPVKPGTAVLIPKREPVPVEKKIKTRRKPVRTLSEQNARLKKRVLWLRILVATLLLIVGVLCLVLSYAQENLDIPLPGQNYHTEETLS